MTVANNVIELEEGCPRCGSKQAKELPYRELQCFGGSYLGKPCQLVFEIEKKPSDKTLQHRVIKANDAV